MHALLKSKNGACVVNVSGASHRGSGVNLKHINFEGGKKYEKFLAYAQSKSANLLFSVGFTNKLGEKCLRSFGVDPGLKWKPPSSRTLLKISQRTGERCHYNLFRPGYRVRRKISKGFCQPADCTLVTKD